MARDFYHDQVKSALKKEGWEITHDPFPLSVGAIGYEVDLGGEKLIAAEKGKEKIAVKSRDLPAHQMSMNFTRRLDSSMITLSLWRLPIRKGFCF